MVMNSMLTPTPNEQAVDMQARAFHRDEKYPYMVVQQLPSVRQITPPGEEAWTGTYALTVPGRPVRYLKEKKVVNLWGVPQTPGEVARDYLMATFTKRRRILSQQLDMVKVHRPQPLFADPGHYHDMAYVDITAFYYTLVNIVGWDVDYYPGLWLKFGRPVSDFPVPQNKPARNALIMTGISSGMRVYKDGQVFTRKTGNRLANFSLWACIQDVAHSIAWAAVGFGAKYINTDGYIIPYRHIDPFSDWLESLGLTPRITRTGDATIYGAGRWAMDGKPINPKLSEDHAYIMNLNPYTQDNWALNRVARIASHIQVDKV